MTVEYTKSRVSKKLLKAMGDELGSLVQEIATQYRIKTLSHRSAPVGSREATLHNSEGQRSWVLMNGKVKKIETVSEHTLGGANLNIDVCGKAPMPEGVTFITVSYLGQYFMYVTTVTGPALAPAE